MGSSDSEMGKFERSWAKQSKGIDLENLLGRVLEGGYWKHFAWHAEQEVVREYLIDGVVAVPIEFWFGILITINLYCLRMWVALSYL